MQGTLRGYEIQQEIGRGGFGKVYQAYQPKVNRYVAIKMILPEYANNEEFIRRFELEAQLIGQLEHPYIVPLYDYWHDRSGAFLVMRWMRGGSLKQRLEGTIVPELDQVRKWIEQVATALSVAHRAGIVHRDIKPGNILLDDDNNAFLADFGIARHTTTNTDQPTQNAFTAIYGAPEQFNSEAITPATDIYSLGIMVYEILAGHPPFDGTLYELIMSHINYDLPPISGISPHLDDQLHHVLLTASAKSPEDRYSTVIEFWDAFASVLDGKNTTIRMPSASVDTTNPFFHRGPIENGEYFFGRSMELTQLFNFIQNGQSASIIGQRRIGKTSLLFALKDPQRLQSAVTEPENYLMIFIDCGAMVNMPPSDIFRFLLEEVEEVLLDSGIDDIAFPQLDKTEVSYRDLERGLRQLFRGKWRLVFLLDEFERLSLNTHLPSGFFTGLRALAMRYPIMYITASRDPLIELTYADESTLSSPFFNIFANIRLELFTSESARTLITELATRTGQHFDDETIDRLILSSGGNPLFTQIAGYHSYELLRANQVMVWRQFDQQFYEDVEAHLQYYWHSLTVDQQKVLTLLPLMNEPNNQLLRELEQLCLVTRMAGNKLNYFTPIFGRFVRTQHVPEIIQVGKLIIDETRYRVLLNDIEITLTPTQYQLLLTLITKPEEPLTTEEIEAQIWQDEIIDDPERLKSVVKGLRRALGDDATHLENVRGIGYRWKVAL